MRVGFIGLGNMGLGMAQNLLKKGIDLTVYSRTESKVDAITKTGAKRARSVADLTDNVDIVLACLVNAEISKHVFLDEGGVISRARPGMILIEHGTLDITTVRTLSAAAQTIGSQFLDAPISGGPERAANGSLSIMVGAEQEPFEIVRPILEMMGAHIYLMGSPSSGTVMKLINQHLVACNAVAAAEAFTLAKHYGIDITTATVVLGNSWGSSEMVKRNGPITANRAFEDSRAPLRNMCKDLKFVEAMSADLGQPLPLVKVAASIYSQLMEMGLGENDISAAAIATERLSTHQNKFGS